jgi:DNA polymerase-4
VDFAEYHRYSDQFKAVMRSVSPLMEDRGIDEAYLDITELDRPGADIAREIKQRIRDETGLTCSIGIAPNKLLAKMASELRKPDGLTILAPEDVETQIWPLGVRKVPGIGPKTEARLAEMGVHTIGELAAVPVETLVERVGRSYGVFLYEAARGIDEDPIVTHWEPKQRSRETTSRRTPATGRRSHAPSPRSRARSPRSSGRRVTAPARSASSCASPTSRPTRARRRSPSRSMRKPRSARRLSSASAATLDRRVRLLGVRAVTLPRR